MRHLPLACVFLACSGVANADVFFWNPQRYIRVEGTGIFDQHQTYDLGPWTDELDGYYSGTGNSSHVEHTSSIAQTGVQYVAYATGTDGVQGSSSRASSWLNVNFDVLTATPFELSGTIAISGAMNAGGSALIRLVKNGVENVFEWDYFANSMPLTPFASSGTLDPGTYLLEISNEGGAGYYIGSNTGSSTLSVSLLLPTPGTALCLGALLLAPRRRRNA